MNDGQAVDQRALLWPERVEILRVRCLDRKAPQADGRYLLHNGYAYSQVIDARALALSEDRLSWQRRVGLRTKARLESLPLIVDDLELLVGRLDLVNMAIDPERLDNARQYLAAYPRPGGMTGHCALHLEPVLSVGIQGLIKTIRDCLDGASGDAADTLQSYLDALAGLTALIEHAEAAALSAAAVAPAWRRGELATMAAVCRRICLEPPQSFREAIQLIWLINLAVEYGDSAGLICPGRLDRILRRFYDADLAAGRLDRESALQFLESYYLLINHFIDDGAAIAVMVGGTDAEGQDVTHELSYLCLEALRRTRLIYPTVGICWHDQTPRPLTRLAVELIAAGYATPAFFNDAVIRRGLEHYGLERAESWNYINSTCVEITPVGQSNVWVASPYISLCHHLQEEIHAQAAAEKPAVDFEQFLAAYFARLSDQITEAAAKQQSLRLNRYLYGRKPLQSVFTRDCIVRSRDLDDGGARINWVECSFVGLANLADSLVVIWAELFDNKTLNFAALKEILDADFAGNEQIRLRFLNKYPKYGNDDTVVDSLVARVAAHFSQACARHRFSPDQSPFIPGVFCWVMHEYLGSQCGATPDGRRKGAPFADGGGPAQGRELAGPTRSILSTTSWNHEQLIGGLAYNMKFTGNLFTSPPAVDNLEHLIVTCLKRGCFETQINVISRQKLEAAEQNPEQYRDLVVRIGGYTDYFTRLSPGMRREIIDRTEYVL